jgi:Ala-tRNA(Pro) deacylase
MELCRGIGSEYGAKHCKNLFLASRNGKRFCLLMMDAEKPFNTGEVSKKLGLPRMGFGTEEQLFDVLGLEQGSVSALGLLNGSAGKAYKDGSLKLAVDSSVRNGEMICVHPNTNTATLVMKTDDLFDFLGSKGFNFEIIEV